MRQFENPNIVVILFLMDIELLIHNYLSGQIDSRNTCDFDAQILSIYSNKYSYHQKYLKEYNVTPSQIIPNHFRIKLIYEKILAEFFHNELKNNNDLYKTLICIERKIIIFFDEYFNFFPYVSIREFIFKIINERNQIISYLSSYS